MINADNYYDFSQIYKRFTRNFFYSFIETKRDALRMYKNKIYTKEEYKEKIESTKSILLCEVRKNLREIDDYKVKIHNDILEKNNASFTDEVENQYEINLIYMCCILYKYFEKQKEQLESERV